MKTTKSEDIRHSLLVEEDDLRFFFDLAKQEYEKLEVSANCIDGSVLESELVDDIIFFENPNYRRIVSISIAASVSD